MRITLLRAALVALPLFFPGYVTAQDLPPKSAAPDPVAVSPEVYTVRLENDHVRVLEMRLRPGRKDTFHGHPSEAVLFLNSGKARITLADGKSIDKDIRAREEMWNGPWAHQVENTGTSDIHAIIVELKGVPTSGAPQGADPVAVSAAQYRRTIDNPMVRVVNLRLGAAEQDVMHVHPGYVAYFISPANLKFAFGDGKSGGRDIPAGEVLWSPPTVHQVANAGQSAAEVWIVEVKKR